MPSLSHLSNYSGGIGSENQASLHIEGAIPEQAVTPEQQIGGVQSPQKEVSPSKEASASRIPFMFYPTPPDVLQSYYRVARSKPLVV